jgi:hypothetical protein
MAMITISMWGSVILDTGEKITYGRFFEVSNWTGRLCTWWE